MKRTVVYLLQLLLIVGLASAIVAPDDPAEADAWYTSKMDEIVAMEQLGNNPEKFRILGKTVRNFGAKLDIQPDERWRKVFDKARTLLLDTPGHAEHFSREVAEHRTINRSDYDRIRERNIADTLQHLPSPETILVLGKFLSDELDSPSTIGSDSISPPGNAVLSAYSLSRIGLRNAPCKAAPAWISLVYDPEFKECLPLFRAWWEEVKSGERAFSFLGKNVEYRIKADGTWAATPLAFDDKALREELKSSVPPTSAATLPPAESAVPPSAISTRWLWIAGTAALLIAAVTWLARKLKR